MDDTVDTGPGADLIFLDLDGVLATHKRSSRAKYPANFIGESSIAYHRHLDLAAVANLNAITRRTNALIVISSTWRSGSEADFAVLIHHLREEGIEAPIIGRTPSLTSNPNDGRGREIQQWLGEKATNAFIILDDDSDMGDLLPHLLLTGGESGLTANYVEPAIELLGDQSIASMSVEERGEALGMWTCGNNHRPSLREVCHRYMVDEFGAASWCQERRDG